MSHSDGETLGLVIRDLKEVLEDTNGMSETQINLVKLSLSELQLIYAHWAPVLNLFRFGSKYQR